MKQFDQELLDITRKAQKMIADIEKSSKGISLFDPSQFDKLVNEFHSVVAKMQSEADGITIAGITVGHIDTGPLDVLMDKFRGINQEISGMKANLSSSTASGFSAMNASLNAFKANLKEVNQLIGSSGSSPSNTAREMNLPELKLPPAAGNIGEDVGKVSLKQQIQEVQELMRSYGNLNAMGSAARGGRAKTFAPLLCHRRG